MRVRTVTVFVEAPRGKTLGGQELDEVLGHAKAVLAGCCSALSAASYEIQTTRVALGDPSEWLVHWPRRSTQEQQAKHVPQHPTPAPPASSCSTTVEKEPHPTKRAKSSAPGCTLLTAELRDELKAVDEALQRSSIDFFNLGCLRSPTTEDVALLPDVLLSSPRFNMSVNVSPGNVAVAEGVALAVRQVAKRSEGGLGNFRLCASACCADAAIPFFPAGCSRFAEARAAQAEAEQAGMGDGKAAGTVRYAVAVGLENGDVTLEAATRARVSVRLPDALEAVMLPHLQAVERACRQAVASQAHRRGISVAYAGIDTSFNPSLDEGTTGSVAAALGRLTDMAGLSDLGALGVVSRATTALQALPVKQTGYRGLMLPVCEDRHLAALAQCTASGEGMDNMARGSAGAPRLTLQHLLILSSVCGVGVDTVPVPGDFDPHRLALLYLDMAGLANRWGKPLSCRVFPVPGKRAGDTTAFESPYLVNTSIFSL